MGMLRSRPKLSDDDLLSLVCQLGGEACSAALREVLAARTKADVSIDYVDERYESLRRAGLVRFVYSAPVPERRLRLTAAGVERLRALQREPVAPLTNGDEPGRLA
jgi:hypothetical protein